MASPRRLISRTATLGCLLMGGTMPLMAADEAATDYWVRVMPSAWFASLGGDAAWSKDGVQGSRFTMGDLGLDNRETTFAIEASAQVPFLFGFHAGYADFSTDGSATLSQDVTFGNHTYNAGTTVDSTSSLRDFYGEICVRPINFDTVGFSIGLAVHATTGEVTIKDAGAGFERSFDETAYIPALALRAHVTLPFLTGLGLEGKLHYLELAYSDQHARYADADVRVSYRPIDYLGVLVGYRYMLIDVHFTDPSGSGSAADLRLALTGPYAGLIAKF
jgi:hypothetical protein